MPCAPRVLLTSLVVVATAAVALTGCAGSDSGSDDAADGGGQDAIEGLAPVANSEFGDETGQSEIEVTVRDNTFQPKYVTVSPGTRVTFDNRGRNPHNVVPVTEDEFETISTDDLQPGDTATLVLDDPGIYPYYCSLHGTKTSGMVGRIKVADQ